MSVKETVHRIEKYNYVDNEFINVYKLGFMRAQPEK